MSKILGVPWRRRVLSAGISSRAVRSTLATYYNHVDDKLYKDHRLRVIGRGSHAIATLSGDQTVTKYYPKSLNLGETEQQQLIEKWDAKQAIVREHLGEIAVMQEFRIDSAPFADGQSIVTAMQTYVRPTEYVELARRPFDPQVLSTTPGLEAFLAANQTMLADNPQAVTDVSGLHNLIVTHKGDLRLIDLIALTANDSDDRRSFDQSVKGSSQYVEAL